MARRCCVSSFWLGRSGRNTRDASVNRYPMTQESATCDHDRTAAESGGQHASDLAGAVGGGRAARGGTGSGAHLGAERGLVLDVIVGVGKAWLPVAVHPVGEAGRDGPAQ
eukprot:2767334-Prymnesium_polylepis.1